MLLCGGLFAPGGSGRSKVREIWERVRGRRGRYAGQRSEARKRSRSALLLCSQSLVWGGRGGGHTLQTQGMGGGG